MRGKDWLLIASMAATGVTAVVTSRKLLPPVWTIGLVFMTGALGYLSTPPRNPHRRDRQTDSQSPRLLGFK